MSVSEIEAYIEARSGDQAGTFCSPGTTEKICIVHINNPESLITFIVVVIYTKYLKANFLDSKGIVYIFGLQTSHAHD